MEIVKRNYTEISIQPQTLSKDEPLLSINHPSADAMRQGMEDPNLKKIIDSSVSDTDLRWTVPREWSEEKGSGMRVVTFKSQEEDPITCTIVSLSGQAGGLRANITRWMRQVKITGLEESTISGFLQNYKTINSQQQFNMKVFDFRSLQSAKDQTAPSILGAIIEADEKSIFVKMTGSMRAIGANEKLFRKLCASLRLNNE